MHSNTLQQVVFFVVSILPFSIMAQQKIDYIEINGNTSDDIHIVSESVDAYVYKNAIDLSSLDAQHKKQAFINMMLPSILIAKDQLDKERKKVLDLHQRQADLTPSEQEYMNKMLKSYKCEHINDLLSRLHTHPTSIVLAQAAIESGWGTSRFYREANNVFGVWSYSTNEPRIKASEDRQGKAIYVRKYQSMPESILSYFKTIARGPYRSFRQEREKTQDISLLLPHLKVYSELGEEYVKRLQGLINFNQLEQYDTYVLQKKK